MVNVLGIPFYDQNLQAAVAETIDACAKDYLPQNHCISASGAHGLVEAHKDPTFKKVLQQFWRNLPDGMPTVWIGRLKGAKHIQRCYGPDFFKEMMLASANLPINHFICGGNEGVAEELKKACSVKFNNNNVVGTYYPPFREMTEEEMQELANQIAQSGAHIVWIGLSAPKQEKFSFRLAKFTQVHFIVAVGAAFDFHTDRVRQAPHWMRQSGLEWFFRLMMEPKRLYKRYVEVVPLFILLNIKELLQYIFKKKSGL
ncbi:MAG: WecB/TagA/CpsF family glycosyl transferase [Chitinophagaceae bacterium]|nr:MAG: WecB/TagA/CpsF family glycosyl [Chitinophagaceae bacterium]TXT29836.1 MAG: WecB/TagA/CpsF family glycosyl transferase [Chitinophagaceae bacterium]